MSDSEKIAKRAYEIWEAEGRPHGRDAEHWRMAAEALGVEERPAAARKPRVPPAAKAPAEPAPAKAGGKPKGTGTVTDPGTGTKRPARTKPVA